VRHGGFVSGFSDYAVVPEAGLIPIPKEFPLEWACLMGCCIPTGWGAVFNAAKVAPHQSVAIFGAGGVGCNTIRAAALALAYPIIAVDLEESKEALAREFGATHFICNSKEDPVPKIQELTGGGVDVAFEVVGDPGSIVQAYWSLAVAGKLCLTGVCRADQQTSLPLIWMPFKQRSIMGHLYGNITTHVDIPKFVDMASRHDMKLDKLITDRFKLEDINDVADKLEKRQIKGRWILAWD
jgi:S-(hydroxymethyl)glutathione dehydrogenase/alcohol dehydrogenase